MSLESDLKKYEKLIATAKKAGEEAQTLMEGIKTKVKTGDYTTGDRIKDFVICTNGLPNEDFEAAYKRLDKRIDGKKEKQILVVEETEREDDIIKYGMDLGRPGLISPMMTHTIKTETLKLGVLREDHLAFDLAENKIIFPVVRYALQLESGRKWALIEEPITFHASEIFLLDEKIMGVLREKNAVPSFVYSMRLPPKPKIYLDKEVEDFFSERLALGSDTSYVDALHLLGAEVPKKFWDAYHLQEEKEKTALVKKIEELVSAELSTDDDEKKVHIGCIKSNLEKALKMGLDLSDMTLPGKTKGVTIKVSEYITDLCRQYGVKAEE